MENKMTAVEWLVKQIENHIHHTIRIPSEYVEQAKEMEKQQIIDAHGDEQSYLQDDGSWRTVSAEQYYNEEYNK